MQEKIVKNIIAFLFKYHTEILISNTEINSIQLQIKLLELQNNILHYMDKNPGKIKSIFIKNCFEFSLKADKSNIGAIIEIAPDFSKAIVTHSFNNNVLKIIT